MRFARAILLLIGRETQSFEQRHVPQALLNPENARSNQA
jgi:hypothetical protein